MLDNMILRGTNRRKNRPKKLSDRVSANQTLAEECDKSKFSKYVESKNSCKEIVGPIKVDNNMVHDNADVCVNDYFTSVFTRDDITRIPACNLIHGGSPVCSSRCQG